jgi:tRNA-specific adenosine deaminase 1
MAAQENAAPWTLPSVVKTAMSSTTALFGREYFSQLGIVRRKPGRSDAPHTLSKSCSDKLALKQCTSLLSSPVSPLVSTASLYISSLVIPRARLSTVGCQRAFAAKGRMHPLAERKWDQGYSFMPFEVIGTKREFQLSQHVIAAQAVKIASCNVAMAWSCNGLHERLIGGVLEGRRSTDSRCGSKVSRRSLWALAREIVAQCPASIMDLQHFPLDVDYRTFKGSPALEARRKVKAEVRAFVLTNWEENTGDDDFRISDVVRLQGSASSEHARAHSEGGSDSAHN